MKGKISKSLFFVIILVILIFAGFNSVYTLRNAEQGVIERFGEQIQVVNQSGVNFKIPFVDRVYKVNTNEVRRIQYGYRPEKEPTREEAGSYVDVEEEGIALTKGGYLVNVGAIIQYRVTNAGDYIYNVDDQSGTIRLAFESVLRKNLQNKDLEDALVNKDTIATEILPELIEKVNSYEVGITITDLKFTDVLLPEQVQFAYDDVNNAKNEKTEYESKAQKYANEKIPEARANAYELIQDAEAYKVNKVSQAKGDVLNFTQVYEKYKNAEEITKKRLYIETMESVLSKVSNKYIIDFEDGGNTVKYLPLNPESLKKEGN